jgi:chromosome segregation ATPase
MTVLTESGINENDASSPPRMKMRLLIQMAETLEDQAAGLYRRAAASEEEEFLLNREIEERQTEINRLVLKLEAMRAERDRLMEKIGSISEEATAIREEIYNGEEEFALAAIEASAAETACPAGSSDEQPAITNMDQANGATFFRRLTLSEQKPNS